MDAATPARKPSLRFRELASGIAQLLFVLGYPAFVYLAYTRMEARALGLLLLGRWGGALLLRARSSPRELWSVVRPHLGLVLLIVVAVALENRTLLLLLPALVSLYICWTFGSTLREGPPMIERFARIVEDDLPDFTLPYCRRVTAIWTAFLGLNALCVGVLAFVAPLGWWALYTGVVFYALLGLLFATEYVFRKLWFRYYSESLGDRVISRLFPPERTANGRRSLAYVARRRAEPATGSSA